MSTPSNILTTPTALMTFRTYLQSLHDTVLINDENLTFVAGNEAMDLDSFCCSLVTAFLLTKTTCLAVPYLPLSRADLRLHRDLLYVMQRTSIDPQWLIFKDDYTPKRSTKLFLVDHNATKLCGKVFGIIDHHEWETKYDYKIENVKLEQCGSCMSAVLNYFQPSKVASIFDQNMQLVSLALSAIVMDTGNLTKKTGQLDLEAIYFLSKYRPEFQPKNSYYEMKEEKKNVKNFSTNDLLRIDYKQWGGLGISTLPCRFKKCFKKSGLMELAKEMVKLKSKLGLETFIVLSGGKKSRDFAITSTKKWDVPTRFPQLKLELKSVILDVEIYEQHNIYMSRKVIAPLFRS